MTHPLAELDGKRKYIFSLGEEDFFFKVVTSDEEMRNNSHIIPMLRSINFEMRDDLNKTLAKVGQRLKEEPQKPAIGGYSNYGVGQDGVTTAIVLEDAAGNPASVMLILINSPALRERLKVDPEVGTFVYVDSLVTAQQHKGKGLLSAEFDKLVTMLANDKRGFSKPFEYAVSMRSAEAVRESDGVEINHMINLPVYAKMWEERFENNKLQKRWCYEGGPGRAGESIPLSDVYDGSLNEAAMSDIIVAEKQRALTELPQTPNGRKFTEVGSFLIGDSREEYAELKQKKQEKFLAKANRGFHRDEEKRKDGWQPASKVAGAKIVEDSHGKSR